MQAKHSNAQNQPQCPTVPDETPNLGSDRVEQVFLRASSAALTQNNDIQCLIDSRENFPAWLNALTLAKHTICIEMYIFASDVFGEKVRDVLLERLQNNVQVFVIYDWFGSLGAHYQGFFDPLIEQGGHIHPYNPPSLTSGLNLFGRNHRKSFVIDNKIAFVSGLCISSQWDGNLTEGISPWRDMGVQLQGPIVQDVLDAFLDTWQSMGLSLPSVFSTEDDAPESIIDASSQEASANARLVATTANNANMMRLDLLAVSMAQKTLWITDAYFMPTRLYAQALINAAKDGVDVRILVPSSSDIKWIGAVSRTQYRTLLEAGARVFEWNGSMIHAKMAIVDGHWARVGSTNLNFSSWFANRELDVAIEDRSTVNYLEQCFLKDLDNSTEVVLNEQSQAKLSEERIRQTSKHHFKNPFKPGHRQKTLQQMAQIGSSLESAIYGSKVVDDGEAWAYISIGVVLMLLAIFVYFVPQILIYPIVFLLLISGVSITLQAVNRLYQLRLQSKAYSSKQSK